MCPQACARNPILDRLKPMSISVASDLALWLSCKPRALLQEAKHMNYCMRQRIQGKAVIGGLATASS